MRCALVIPTRNAGAHLDRLLPALVAQRRQPDSILVVDSRSSDDTVERFRAFGARVEVIEPASFNHGGTRRWASQQVEADALIYLTQDAIPASPDSFANLLDELYAEADIGVAYGRQLPHPGAGLLGAQARRFNYPPESRSKRLADASELGIRPASVPTRSPPTAATPWRPSAASPKTSSAARTPTSPRACCRPATRCATRPAPRSTIPTITACWKSSAAISTSACSTAASVGYVLPSAARVARASAMSSPRYRPCVPPVPCIAYLK